MDALFKAAVALLLLAVIFVVSRAPIFIRTGIVILLCLLADSARSEDGPVHQKQPAWLKPYVEILGCVIAEQAVRGRISPMPIQFEPCTYLEKFVIAISDDLRELSISGSGQSQGVSIPFEVEVSHYPGTFDKGGYVMTHIEVRPLQAAQQAR